MVKLDDIEFTGKISFLNKYCPECGTVLDAPVSPEQKNETVARKWGPNETRFWGEHEHPRGIFERGDEVYWDTAKTVLSPKLYRRYETVSHVVKDVHDDSMAVAFDHGGWQPIQKVHHIWEEIDE